MLAITWQPSHCATQQVATHHLLILKIKDFLLKIKDFQMENIISNINTALSIKKEEDSVLHKMFTEEVGNLFIEIKIE